MKILTFNIGPLATAMVRNAAPRAIMSLHCAGALWRSKAMIASISLATP
jgi:hypothetical protein